MEWKFLTTGGQGSPIPSQISDVVKAVDEVLAVGSTEAKKSSVSQDENVEGGANQLEVSLGEQEGVGLVQSREEQIDKMSPPIELTPFSRMFTCTLQYSSNSEYEKILQWADNSSSQGLLKFERESSLSDEMAAKQVQEINEITAWRMQIMGR